MYITEDYNFYIVALSIVIAILASYSALSIVAKISRTKGITRIFWTLSGSFVMGIGVWSMHFVGMMALHLHMSVRYDVWLTLLSLAVSVGSSFIAFYITIPKYIKSHRIILGGLFMGGGVVAMHYIGMEAMIMHATVTYDRNLLILSIAIALLASYGALLLFLRFRNQNGASWLKWLSASLMGLAICGMHYTGMKAAQFQDHSEGFIHESSDINFILLYSVTVAVFIILLISWGTMFFDRYVLEKMAYQDSTTSLPNRNEMNRFFDTHTGEENIGLLFLDLDQFKAVNDTLGHHIGDILIQEVSVRLGQFVNQDQQAFRIGGDEFLFIIRECTPEQAGQLAKQILHNIKQVFSIDEHELYVTASIGISMGSVQNNDRSKLLRAADTAMYKAKSLGKNRYCVYNEEMGVQEIRKMELEKDLIWALKQNQFYLVYQPKWNAVRNCLVGFEALIRWKHPRLGVVSPGEFIPIAEETGLIVPLTKWTLEEACRQGEIWQRQDKAHPVSVNLSVRLFQTGGLTELVDSVLNKTELSPHLLELEITETMVLYDIDDIIRQIRSIRDLGVKVSMDDFGTGYSSIALLDRLPLNALKLDRLFTNDLETPRKRAILSAIILMADQLHLEVIAEGVENKEHFESLLGLGCQVMQGYYYGKPMEAKDIGEWMDNHTEGFSQKS